MNFIAFVKFSDTPQLIWNECIPYSVSEHLLHQHVRRFIASVDMSTAIFKPYHLHPFDNSHDRVPIAPRSNVVNFEDGSLFVAKQSEQNANEWHGILLNPRSKDDAEMDGSIIVALEQVAKSTILSSACISSKLHRLCSVIRSLYATDNWWRAQSLFLHLRDGLVELGRMSTRDDDEHMKRPFYVPNTAPLSRLQVLKHSLMHSLPCKNLSVCVFSPTSEIVLNDNLTNAETNMLCWYYKWVFSIGNRTRRRYYFETASETTVRLWFQTNEWRTVAQVEVNEISSPISPWPMLQAARDLMETLASEYH